VAEPTAGTSLTRAAEGLIAIVLVLLLAFIPLVASTYLIRILTGIFLFVALASAWNLIGGYAGYADFGPTAFLGIGAYTTGILMTQAHMPFPLALAAGGLCAMGAAAGIGAVLLRLRGHYFAIASLGFMLVMEQVAANLEITGGGSGMNLPVARGFTPFYYWMLTLALAAIGTGALVPRLRAGYALGAIRGNQEAAQVVGVRPLPYKVLAYVGSALFFALAGGVYAYWFTFIDPPTVFDPDFGIQAIVMVLFGGAGTVLGPAGGAIVLKSLDILLTNTSGLLHNVFFGGLICVLVLFAPRGLVELLRAGRRHLPDRRRLQRSGAG